MLRHFNGMLSAVLLVTAPLHAVAQQPEQGSEVKAPSVGEAAAVVDAFHAALARNDKETALLLLADDVLIFEAGGVERSKAEYASHHLAADSAFSAAVPSALLRRSGDIAGDLAWIASEGRATGKFKDRAVDRFTTESMTLKRTTNGWRIIHIHWSSRAATP